MKRAACVKSWNVSRSFLAARSKFPVSTKVRNVRASSISMNLPMLSDGSPAPSRVEPSKLTSLRPDAQAALARITD